MEMKSLYKVPVTEKSADINFESNGDKSFNVVANGTSLTVAPVTFKKVCTLPKDIVPARFYQVEGKRYCLDILGNLWQDIDGVYTRFVNATFTSEPHITPVIYQGEKRILIFSKEKGVLKGLGEEEVTIPYGKAFTIFKGMLFVAEGSVLRFSAPFNFTDFTIDLTLGGFIEVDNALGEIMGIAQGNDGLTLLCKHGAVYLEVKGERVEYTLKNLQTDYIDVKDNTVAQVNGGLCFISGNKICYLKKGKIAEHNLPTYLGEILDFGACNLNGERIHFGAGGENRTYFVYVTTTLGNFILCFSTDKKECYLLNAKRGMSAVGGLFGANVERKDSQGANETQTEYTVYRAVIGGSKNALANEEDDYKGYYLSNPINFNNSLYKRVSKINLSATSQGQLTVYAEEGKKTFSIKKGENFFRANLRSRAFTFEVNLNENRGGINLNVTYAL